MATNPAVTTAAYAAFGAVFGALKFWKGHDPNEQFRRGQFAKTVLIWAIGGVLTSQSGGALTQGAIAATTAGVAPTVNALWDAYLPPEFGGSNTHGTGTKNQASTEDTDPSPNLEAAQRIENADLRTLRSVAKHFDDLSTHKSKGALRRELSKKDPVVVLAQFETVTENDQPRPR